VIELGSQMAFYVRAVLGRSERGSSLVEYVLLLALIAVVCLLALTYLGEATSGRLSKVSSQVAAS
jgi:Flp pilus assembly pilin Flp